VSHGRPALLCAMLLVGGLARAAAPADLDDLSGSRVARQLAAARGHPTGAARKVDARLRSMAWPGPSPAPRSGLVPVAPMQHAPDGRVRAYVTIRRGEAGALAALRRAGAEVELADPARARVQALVDAAQVRALAALPSVVAIRPAEPGRTRTGSVTSEGDAAARADLVRGLGYDGSGTVVGIISDGIDHAASAQGTGDLPAVTVPADPRCHAGSGDEGTALLEIVHDLAPGAGLLFSGGLDSSMAFIESIGCLTRAGASVIADDLAFFDEPFFADGPIASAARAAVAAGVSYHSATGNEALEHVQQPFRDSMNGFHDFLGGPVDNTDDMLVAPGDMLVCILQWNDPFGGSANDYDLGLLDASLNVIAASTGVQDGTQDPIEIVAVTNTASTTQVAKAVIQKAAGADRVLKLYCLQGVNQQYVTPGSVFAQAGVPEVVSVGAMNVMDQSRMESFSSLGPAQILLPAPEMRPKPDLAAFDGVSITNAGGFPGCTPPCRFFGTSAAVPHSAAVAALLLSKNPFLTPSALRDALTSAAVDVPPAGFDQAAGAGRLDAFAALAAVPLPGCATAADCADGDACTTDDCQGGQCVHVPRACTDGDPCTSDACDPATGCRFSEPPAIDYIGCALARRLAPLLPAPHPPARAASAARRLLAKLHRAERHVARATGAPPARARRELARARRAIGAMARLARRRLGDLGRTIVEPIVSETAAIASRMRALQQTI
jgi:subtilisin family serine protease